MKRKLIYMISIIAVVVGSLNHAYAAEINRVTVRDNIILLSGEVSPGLEYTITVFDKNYTPGPVSAADMEAHVVGFHQDNSGENGEFTKNIPINSNLESGTYYVKVVDETGQNVAWESFDFLSHNDIQAIVQEFNNTATDKEIAQRITDYRQRLVLERIELYDMITDSSAIFKKMYMRKLQKPFMSFIDISLVYDQSAVLCLLEQQETADEMLDIIYQYDDILKTNIVTNSFFKKLNKKSQVTKYLLGNSFDTVEDFRESFTISFGLRCFEQLGRGDMESLIETFKEYIDFPAGYFSGKYSETDFKEMYKRLAARTEYRDFDEVSDVIKTIANDDSRGSSGGGNSSGGSSMGGGSLGRGAAAGTGTIITTDIVPEKPDIPDPVQLFNDLETVEWAKEAVMFLAGKRIISGYGERLFLPNNNISRAEFAKMVVSAFGYIDESANVEFFDVSSDSWYYQYVAAGVKHGLLKGIGYGIFGPEENITRQDMAVILYRAMEKTGVNIDEVREYITFEDEDQISDYAAEAVKALYKRGIVNGSGSEFQPQTNSTRAMAAKMLYELIVRLD